MPTAFQTDAFQAETEWPDPTQVESGVEYGPNGDDYIGSLEMTPPGLVLAEAVDIELGDEIVVEVE